MRVGTRKSGSNSTGEKFEAGREGLDLVSRK